MKRRTIEWLMHGAVRHYMKLAQQELAGDKYARNDAARIRRDCGMSLQELAAEGARFIEQLENSPYGDKGSERFALADEFDLFRLA